MKIVGEVAVTLPFSLEYCAEGPDIPDIRATVNGIDVSIAVPPSMAEKTDGRSFFASGWAWWTGSLISMQLSRSALPADGDFDVIRKEFESAANESLRRFLNAYRVRFHKPHIHPVKIDPKLLDLDVVHDDESVTAFPESASAYFYASLPADAPISASINRSTTALIEYDLANPTQSIGSLLELDAEWLESLGEHARAARIRTLL